MDTIQSTFQKIPGVGNTEARNVAKKLNRLDKVAIMIDEDKLATKEDIAESRALTKADIAEFKSEIKEDIAEFKSEIRENIAEFKSEIRENIAASRAATQADIVELKTDGKAMKWMLGLLLTVNIAFIVSAVGVIVRFL